jgi:hypothetical protein
MGRSHALRLPLLHYFAGPQYRYSLVSYELEKDSAWLGIAML